MTITIRGAINDFRRIPTDLYSFDALLADHRGTPGFPAYTITELYGPPGIGKSTIATYLAGRLSVQTGGTLLPIVDLEKAYEEQHMVSTLSRSGFSGMVWLVEMVDGKGKPRTHEEILEEAVGSLTQASVSVLIVDSIGALMSSAEAANPFGSANMGQRGRLMAQVCRKIIYYFRDQDHPKFTLLVNHQYDQLGGIGKGRVTPGGKSKEYLAANRITLYNKERFDNGDSLVALKTDKLRIGGNRKDARAFIYIVPGLGVSPEMTAVFDCIIAGLASRKAVITLSDGTKCGRLSSLRDAAIAGDPEPFVPFKKALQYHGFHDMETEKEEE